MTDRDKARCVVRFRELAAKEAVGLASFEDVRKLDRYQALLRNREEETEHRKRAAQMDWQIRRLNKLVKAEMWRKPNS